MNEKSYAAELVTKASHLYKYLTDEKTETVLSARFFDKACLLSESVYSLKNSQLSKQDSLSLRKDAVCHADGVELYLDAIYTSALISEAQRDSMQRTLNTLKKEINI